MFSKILSFITGGGMTSIENIATEWIETDLESAEAKVLKIKALDPNGKMRRDLSKDVSQMYKLYLVVSLLLLTCEFLGTVILPLWLRLQQS